jgi:hypothetical protein
VERVKSIINGIGHACQFFTRYMKIEDTRALKHDAAKLAEPGVPAHEWIYTAAKPMVRAKEFR